MTAPVADWVRPGPTAEQRRNDWYLAALLAACALVSMLLLNSSGAFALGPPPSWPEQIAWSVGVTAPLAWRRRWPELTTLVVAALFIYAQVRANSESFVSAAALFLAIYTLGAWGRNRRRAAVIRILVIGAMFCWLAIAAGIAMQDLGPDAFQQAAGPLDPVLASLITAFLYNGAFFTLAYLFGNAAWVSARREHTLKVQAEALRQSQVERAERAVMQERVRIAQELHDVVAHHVTVINVQAAASRRVLDKDPAKAKVALAAVEQSARTAVDELRRLLGVLRDAGGADTDGECDQLADHRLDRVETLLNGAREAGLVVKYQVFGTPVPLTDALSLAVYRILQEALTNTIKHAHARTVDVRVRYLQREIELDVTDDGRARADNLHGPWIPLNRAAGGLGLIGMRERVAAHGGVLEVGPRADGGFRVRARLPLQPGDQSPDPAPAVPVVDEQEVLAPGARA